MNMNKSPDYIGDWMLIDDLKQKKGRVEARGCSSNEEYELLAASGIGHFLMFVDDRVRQLHTEKISGRIIDSPLHGSIESTFEGELGTGFIRFIKRYPKELAAKGFFVGEIIYEGKKVGEMEFRGEYYMKHIKNNLGIQENWGGQFVLMRYINPSSN